MLRSKDLTFTSLLSSSTSRLVVLDSTLRTTIPTLPPHTRIDLHRPSSNLHPIQVLHRSTGIFCRLKVDECVARVPPCEGINRHGDASDGEAILDEERFNVRARGGVEKIADVETCAGSRGVSCGRRASLIVAVLIKASVVPNLWRRLRSRCTVLHTPVARGLGSTRWDGAAGRLSSVFHIGDDGEKLYFDKAREGELDMAQLGLLLERKKKVR